MKSIAGKAWAFAFTLLLAGCAAQPPHAAAPALGQMQVDAATRLAYVDEGRGAPVVFVHGAMSDHRSWAPQREAFKAALRFIALDQRAGAANRASGCRGGQRAAGRQRRRVHPGGRGGKGG